MLKALKQNYGVTPTAGLLDLGGSSNLNLLVNDGPQTLVLRVYRPSVSTDRLRDIQHVRRQLAAAGFPCLPPILSADGLGWATVDDRLMELEDFVETDGRMDSPARVESGLRVLGGMHSVLRHVECSHASEAPPFVNYVAPGELVDACRRGVMRIRSWRPTQVEARLADASEELAYKVTEAYRRLGESAITHQLVHGDFWDNNVLYRGADMVLIHDFDHMGMRARIEDVALTVYYLNSERRADPEQFSATFRRSVHAYESGLADSLSAVERAALPIALARQPLWSIGGWIANLDDEGAARGHASEMLDAIELALEIMRTLPLWQEAVA